MLVTQWGAGIAAGAQINYSGVLRKAGPWARLGLLSPVTGCTFCGMAGVGQCLTRPAAHFTCHGDGAGGAGQRASFDNVGVMCADRAAPSAQRGLAREKSRSELAVAPT